jgi:tetratricopeptide (TPR) repeat protein
LEQSIRHFQLAIRTRPTYLNAARNLKLALFINEKINTAAKSMSDALILNLQDSLLDQQVDEILRSKYELNQAIAHYQKSLAGQPGYVNIDTAKISVVSNTKQQYENTLPVFKKIIELRPDIAETYYTIACIYSRQGKNQESIRWLNQAFQKGFDKWEMIRTDIDLENIRNLSNYKQFAKDH